jgi:hypothetical protein
MTGAGKNPPKPHQSSQGGHKLSGNQPMRRLLHCVRKDVVVKAHEQLLHPELVSGSHLLNEMLKHFCANANPKTASHFLGMRIVQHDSIKKAPLHKATLRRIISNIQ